MPDRRAYSPLHFVMEVVRDDGTYEAPNERVVILRSVGQLSTEVRVTVYGAGNRGDFQPGDQYELFKREKRDA